MQPPPHHGKDQLRSNQQLPPAIQSLEAVSVRINLFSKHVDVELLARCVLEWRTFDGWRYTALVVYVMGDRSDHDAAAQGCWPWSMMVRDARSVRFGSNESSMLDVCTPSETATKSQNQTTNQPSDVLFCCCVCLT
jgi:hypothetical protein